MAETNKFDCTDISIQDIQHLARELCQLRARIHDNEQLCTEKDVLKQISLICELFETKNVVKSLYIDLTRDLSSHPSIDASNIWKIIETHASSPEKVKQGTYLLEQYFKLKMRLIIDSKDYERTIPAYLKWQEETVKIFVNEYKQKPETESLKAIEDIWNWNNRPNEAMFFGGAARPLHIKTVTAFSSQISVYYDTLWPDFKENRSKLVNTLDRQMREECDKFWPDHQIFPSTGSQSIIDKCLQYFFFRDRTNTWFINSSASDYITFVHSAREIFAEKFIGSTMKSPDEHTTDWISCELIRQCSKLESLENQSKRPTIVILLTSKNRFGQRIDVDFIHNELNRRISKADIVTLVDACQDGTAFKDVDITIYSKRWMTTGALGVVNKIFLSKHPFLCKKLTASVNFPVGILAQIYINMFMINLDLVHGVDELANSSWWKFWRCPMQTELNSTFQYRYDEREHVRYQDGPLEYSFYEDFTGTILRITSIEGNQTLLAKLWALLKKQGHTIDCFVMDNPYLNNNSGISTEVIRDCIDRRFIDELRRIEAASSDHLAWPLVPCWITSSEQISVEELHEHFNICCNYQACLRLSLGRCAYPGKIKRFVNHVRNIFQTGQLDESDATFGKHSSQWP